MERWCACVVAAGGWLSTHVCGCCVRHASCRLTLCMAARSVYLESYCIMWTALLARK